MNRRKSIVMIAMVALLLTFTVSGTIAWLAASTDELVNTFTPGEIKTEIEEHFDGKTKSSIRIENDKDNGSTVPVYVRVAISGYWVNETGEIVRPWTDSVTLNTAVEADADYVDIVPKEGVWFYCPTDGFYYFSLPLDPGEMTTNLLGEAVVYEVVNGETLVMNVIHQSIQAEPASTVTAEWGVTVATDGTITKN